MTGCLYGIPVLIHYCPVTTAGEHNLAVQPNCDARIELVADGFDPCQVCGEPVPRNGARVLSNDVNAGPVGHKILNRGGQPKLQQIARQKLVDI